MYISRLAAARICLILTLLVVISFSHNRPIGSFFVGEQSLIKWADWLCWIAGNSSPKDCLRKEDIRKNLLAPSKRLKEWDKKMPLNYSTWLQESWACLSKDLWWYFRYRVLHPTDLFWILFTTAGKIPGSRKPLLFLLSFGWIVKKTKEK